MKSFHALPNASSSVLEDMPEITRSASDLWNYSNTPSPSHNINSTSSGSTLLSNFAIDNPTISLEKPVDVPVDAVVSAIYFNSAAFIFLMLFYEFLRRVFPTVYSARQRLNHMGPVYNRKDNNPLLSLNQNDDNELYHEKLQRHSVRTSSSSMTIDIEDIGNHEVVYPVHDVRPFDWLLPVLGISWSKVLESSGLDGYFFLRYIRMCVRITSVSSFWFCVILLPIYATGNNSSESATGLYYISIEHIPADGCRMWIACLFAYLFSFFIFFVVEQEYRHFLEVTQDFLCKGSIHVNPQNQYSILVENVPYELRSDRALKEYFNTLFPGKVHSASVVLKLPDLEKISRRCLRTCRQLEKSIALFQATGKRPTKFVCKRSIENFPMTCPVRTIKICGNKSDQIDEDEASMQDPAGSKPEWGKRVDSIKYYTNELALNSRALYRMQQQKTQIAESGNETSESSSWIYETASSFANQILDESAIDNSFVSSNEGYVASVDAKGNGYGAIDDKSDFNGFQTSRPVESKHQKLSIFRDTMPLLSPNAKKIDDSHQMIPSSQTDNTKLIDRLGSGQHIRAIVRILSRLGLDFFIFVTKFVGRQVDYALEGVWAETMSSTGMVTFLDLSSVACAVAAPLTLKASVIDVCGAPEPREIIWENAHVSKTFQAHREMISNVVLMLGVLLWSFPLAFIQAVAKLDVIARIPGMEWLMKYKGGYFSTFINGYLPVVALLVLIMILPVIFEYIAVKFEQRKTFSDVQSSVLGRYFNYQLVNIYVTVTAGSLLRIVADIVDHPIQILTVGATLPSMAGYFLALLVTKILSGLPMVFLRFGGLMRMIYLTLVSNEKKLTQREIDDVYQLENVQYGSEFPTQLLVVVIVFTYSIMCPIILPVGMIYFLGALTVYKKQILYVYSPVYESGGAMFPPAVQKMMFGLVCSQITFLGYIVSRGASHHSMFLAPLPAITILVSNYFKKTYADNGEKLNLESARMCDRLAEKQKIDTKSLEAKFDKMFYRQPVLTEAFREPWTYRRGVRDKETVIVRDELRRRHSAITQTQMKGIVSSLKALKSSMIGLKPNVSGENSESGR